MNVLVIDDDLQVLSLVARALARHGHEVVVAASKDEALATDGTLDVAIVDVVLGVDDGPSLAIELLRDKAMRVVFFTSGATGDAIGRAREIGPVIAKGRGLAELMEAVAATST